MTSMLCSLSNFNTEDVISSCTLLSAARLKVFSKTNVDTTSQLNALSLWIEDILSALSWDIEQLKFVLAQIEPTVAVFCEELSKAVSSNERKDKLPVVYIAIADRRYVVITGMDDIVDIEEFSRIKQSQLAFLETIQYNLTTLFMRRMLPIMAKKNIHHNPSCC